jgi:hypothetical protein
MNNKRQKLDEARPDTDFIDVFQGVYRNASSVVIPKPDHNVLVTEGDHYVPCASSDFRASSETDRKNDARSIVHVGDELEDTAPPVCKRGMKTEMVQCSHCTMACIVVPDQLCGQCHLRYTHLCEGCAAAARLISTNTCHRCSYRAHICLSRCLGGCIKRKQVNCRCGTKARRRVVEKKNKNEGRYFYSCFKCEFFEWEY